MSDVAESPWWRVPLLGAALLSAPLGSASACHPAWVQARLDAKFSITQSSTAETEPSLLIGTRGEWLIQDIERFQVLDRPNWDGDDARAIPQRAVWDAVSFVSDLEGRSDLPMPHGAAASPDGEIVLYWVSESSYIEINFAGLDAAVCHRFDGNEVVVEEGVSPVGLLSKIEPLLDAILTDGSADRSRIS